jgi:hypothetical protein
VGGAILVLMIVGLPPCLFVGCAILKKGEPQCFLCFFKCNLMNQYPTTKRLTHTPTGMQQIMFVFRRWVAPWWRVEVFYGNCRRRFATGAGTPPAFDVFSKFEIVTTHLLGNAPAKFQISAPSNNQCHRVSTIPLSTHQESSSYHDGLGRCERREAS